MLSMKREDLARLAEVAPATLAGSETGKRQPQPRTLAAIRAALETAGVEFLDGNGGGPGVRLKVPPTPGDAGKAKAPAGPDDAADA
ncbi:helix-turn-helix domain-containing protein [Roseospira navarrensis]|uniref:Transcriptional regulator n=1 Tax=Roseospira navarrensis TaxID=140058 RepID=A0A7X1ZHC3_9PROT|nr:helix-turn-helix transcriptional regulator [Roseospira navarrensis]MQX38546.1 transcriptional regulator [Roseospira navarrensis]